MHWPCAIVPLLGLRIQIWRRVEYVDTTILQDVWKVLTIVFGCCIDATLAHRLIMYLIGVVDDLIKIAPPHKCLCPVEVTCR